MDWQPITTVPAEDHDLLVAWNDGIIEIMTGSTARDYKMRKCGGYLTHWMLLPARPRDIGKLNERAQEAGTTAKQ